MDIRFWGVRGSVATSGPQVARVGGNTACVEVVSGGERLVFDAGTGLRALGEALQREALQREALQREALQREALQREALQREACLPEAAGVRATLLWSHLHWDHVQGFPFFAPAFAPSTALTLYGPGAGGDRALEEVLAGQMRAPTFPVPLAAMRGARAFRAARPGEPFEVGPFRVRPFLLDHPQGCLGYRVEADGACFVYATDVELCADALPREVAEGLAGADLLVLDAQYTPEEYAGRGAGPARRGWGHSTHVEAARVARACGVGRLHLFHHDPARTDDAVEAMAEEARALFPATEPAREGACVRVGRPAAPQGSGRAEAAGRRA
jgi:phosphoribosyl 1,2-cyclic phosphodiesterase